MRIKWTNEELRYLNVFESLTGATAKDVEIQGDTLIFFVEEGHVGLAVGRRGEKVKQLENLLGKKIRIIELPDDPGKFAVSFLKPARIEATFVSQKSDGTKVLNIVTRDKGLIRGKIKKLKEYLKKYFGIEEVVIV